MTKHYVFCEECRQDVEYMTKTSKASSVLKGEVYEYFKEIAYCPICGEEVYVPKIHDNNIRALREKFRTANNIITLEMIRKIPEKYNIGKRPLSLLLGWGELTFTRYFDGDVPTKKYSEVLDRIYKEPEYFNAILENHRDLLSDSAYTKSKQAVENILKEKKFSKIKSIILYLLRNYPYIGLSTLQKSLYYIQGFYYAFYNKFIFSEDCEAEEWGPAYNEAYIIYKKYIENIVRDNRAMKSHARAREIISLDLNSISTDIKFSEQEKSVVNSVAKNLCCYNGQILEIFVRAEMPWIMAVDSANGERAEDQIVIKKELIGEYFSLVKNRYQMISVADIRIYAKDMFEKTYLE